MLITHVLIVKQKERYGLCPEEGASESFGNYENLYHGIYHSGYSVYWD